jgi:hypothetical protein
MVYLLNRLEVVEPEVETSIAMLENSIALAETALGDEHPYSYIPMRSLMSRYHASGRIDEATEMARRSLRTAERSLGHPSQATMESAGNLALLQATSDCDAAIATVREYLLGRHESSAVVSEAQSRRSLIAGSFALMHCDPQLVSDVADRLADLGGKEAAAHVGLMRAALAVQMGFVDRATEELDAIGRDNLNHRMRGDWYVIRFYSSILSGNLDAAAELLEFIEEQPLRPELRLRELRFNLAMARGQPSEALEALGDHDPSGGMAHRGRALTALGRHEEALHAYETIISSAFQLRPRTPRSADTTFDMVKSLVATGELERARTIVPHVKMALEPAGEHYAPLREEVDAWLVEHGTD